LEQDKNSRLVVFDVEGVLIPKNRFFFALAKNQGKLKFLKVLIIGVLYNIGILGLEYSLKHIFANFKGSTIEQMQQVFSKIPATPQLKSFMEQLKLRQYKIALISSGLPDVVVEKFAQSIGADYCFGIEVQLENGALTGLIDGDVIYPSGKQRILDKILQLESLPLSKTVVVADDRNNASMFLPQVLKIAFNSDFVLRSKADFVAGGKLSSILPIIDRQKVKWTFPSKNDLTREAIHASGIFIPLIAMVIGVLPVAVAICIISAVYIASEISRLEGKNLPVISSITKRSATQTEFFGFVAAPLYFALGILLTVLLFPIDARASGAAIAIFCFGDSAASIIGGSLGKRLPFNKGKTFEGTFGGFFFAFLAGLIFVSPLFALVGAAFAMAIEALPLPINDNVLIPVATGLLLTFII
jgi:phosphoserine phosphatase